MGAQSRILLHCPTTPLGSSQVPSVNAADRAVVVGACVVVVVVGVVGVGRVIGWGCVNVPGGAVVRSAGCCVVACG